MTKADAEGGTAKQYVLAERDKGNIVVVGIEGVMSTPLSDFVEQPADGILYDLNRLEEVVLTFIDDPKWVNDFAVAQTIRKLVDQRDAANRRIAELEGYNVGLADEVRIVRGALDDLVDAIDGSANMDEMDGPEYNAAQDELEKALAAGRPHTEKAITQQAIAALEGGRDVYK